MLRPVKDYLTFTKKERNGLVVVLSLVLLVIIYLSSDIRRTPDHEEDLAAFADEMNAFYGDTLKSVDKHRLDTNHSVSKVHKEPDSAPYVFHPFNPNDVADEEWEKMGLKPWQAQAIRRYREKAGNFKTKGEFKKLNAVNDEFYIKVERFLTFGDNTGEEETGNIKDESLLNNEKKPETLLLELNASTAEQLRRLKGIGPAYSERIIKYRDRLGGYYKIQQLMEVYGLEDSLYNAILPFLNVDTMKIVKININKAMISVLGKHPYIKRNVATAIVNYRDQHGPYKNVEGIKHTDLVSDELYRKIAPYFSVVNN